MWFLDFCETFLKSGKSLKFDELALNTSLAEALKVTRVLNYFMLLVILNYVPYHIVHM